MIYLSDNDLAFAQELLKELTPGDYDLGRSGTMTHAEALAWFAGCLEASPRTDLFGVFSDPADSADSRLIALTGNGPNSERNAHAICNLLRLAPYLVAELVERRQAAMTWRPTTALAALQAGELDAIEEELHRGEPYLSLSEREYQESALRLLAEVRRLRAPSPAEGVRPAQ